LLTNTQRIPLAIAVRKGFFGDEEMSAKNAVIVLFALLTGLGMGLFAIGAADIGPLAGLFSPRVMVLILIAYGCIVVSVAWISGFVTLFRARRWKKLALALVVFAFVVVVPAGKFWLLLKTV
jgi:hypothetical protein